jgi:hypothetical protein
MRKLFIFLLLVFSYNLLQAEEAKLTRGSEERLIQRVESVFSSKKQKLPAIPSRCATPIFLQLFSVKDRLSEVAKSSLSKYSGRPYYSSESVYDTPGGHFKIHYTPTGDSAVFEPSVDVDPFDGVPDYVNRCGEIMDSVWMMEVDSLNYYAPPGDGSNGGDGRYDVYLLELSPDYYGYTSGEEFVSYPSATSYIVLRNHYLGFGYPDQYDALRVTAAHEFFHAIQFGYDATEFEYTDPQDPETFKPYWMEMSAVWMEDVCYDQINDYLSYLPWFYNYPWLSLKTFSYNWSAPESSYHAYGSCVFPIFLSEKFGRDIIRQIWERCSYSDSASFDFSTDDALNYDYGGRNLNEEFRQFTLWNYFTGSRADTINFYSEGNSFEEVEISQSHSLYPIDVSSITHPPSKLASNYIRFVTGGSPGGLRIHFDGEDEANWKVSLIGYRSGLSPLLDQFDLDSLNQEGTLEVYNWQDYEEIVMIPAAVDWEGDVFSYVYSAEFDNSLVSVGEEYADFALHSFSLGQNHPNPFNATTVINFTVYGSQSTVHNSLHTSLKIYNIRGQLVRTLLDEEKQAGHYSVVWDGKDNEDSPVSSGIYFYKLEGGNFEKTKKMVMIK